MVVLDGRDEERRAVRHAKQSKVVFERKPCHRNEVVERRRVLDAAAHTATTVVRAQYIPYFAFFESVPCLIKHEQQYVYEKTQIEYVLVVFGVVDHVVTVE